MSFEIRKIVNRLKEADGKPFTFIPVQVITAEKKIALLRQELVEERLKEKPDDGTIQILNSRLITAIRLLEDTRKNIKNST